jgi:hydroxylaminobenzene mutase
MRPAAGARFAHSWGRNAMSSADNRGRVLMRLGAILFLCGLVIGFIAWRLANPRMGLSSHLEGVMNGTFLITVGLLWDRLKLGRVARTALFWTSVYGTYSNVAATLLAAWLPAGEFLSIAAPTPRGTDAEEQVIMSLLNSTVATIALASVLIVWGLRGRDATAAQRA